jgi:hypothetical protein
MERFSCPYLQGVVELSKDRERHIRERHPDLLPQCRDCIAETLLDPDEVRRSRRSADARLFSRWFDTIRGASTLWLSSSASHRQSVAIGSSQRILPES